MFFEVALRDIPKCRCYITSYIEDPEETTLAPIARSFVRSRFIR